VYRREVRPFTDKQIALLQSFAAQAVIAMENARLITETREALDQQTATAEVLGVINASPGDLAPVFDAVLDKAMRLCDAAFGTFLTYDGEVFHAVAHQGVPTPLVDSLREPGRPTPGGSFARLVGGEAVVHLADIADDNAYRRGLRGRVAMVDVGGARTAVWVALRKDDALLGTLVIYRQEVRPFSDKQLALLQNFAAQAVIAMENARLITETRERTRDLQESLEYQTATSDVLKVISQSTFDLEPVLEYVVETAVRLCRAHMGSIFRLEGGLYRWSVAYGIEPAYREIEQQNPIAPGTGTLVGRVALEGRAVQIADIDADPLYVPKDEARIGRARTLLGVPLLREGVPIGVIAMARDRVEPFNDKEIALVTTFADQAVIAIENARLLGELRERTEDLAHSVEELKALAEVGQEVSSTLDLGAVLSTVLNRSVALTGADAGVIFRYSQGRGAFRLAEAVGWEAALMAQVREMHIDRDATLMGEAVSRHAPAHIADLRERPSNVLRDATLAAGYRSVLIVPLVGADQIYGALLLHRRRPSEFPEAALRLMQTLAAQSVLAIQNARLFREIADKSEQLALASQHKSQFLANMSHELRTPLNAILGYSELMVDGIYGELPPRAAGVLERVQNNGKHLLALINDVLDLAKIEAGQLTLTLEDYALPDVVQSVVSATEGLASTKGLKMSATVATGLPTGHGDARRLSQVLLNLVGNAVKFTDEGEVAIGALAEDGHFVLTVRDTGPGIAPEDQDKIFGEFQQVDNSNTRKKGGTGLGLAISKRMVEMQGGSITVESEFGRGATFRVTLPIRVEEVADELTGELMGAA
jgi:signal transduction histidine kinase